MYRQINSGVIHEVEGHKAEWKTNQYQMEARDSSICYPNINILISVQCLCNKRLHPIASFINDI